MRVLLLNSTYEPLAFLTERRALKLLAREKVDVINTWTDTFIRTVSGGFDCPATLRLKNYVRRSYKKPRFTKYALFNRDEWKCQYCGCVLNYETVTVDHIIPRSKGGKTSWKNCISSCKSCNKRKADKDLEETNFTLRSNPGTPEPFHFWDRRVSSKWNNEWELYTGRKC